MVVQRTIVSWFSGYWGGLGNGAAGQQAGAYARCGGGARRMREAISIIAPALLMRREMGNDLHYGQERGPALGPVPAGGLGHPVPT